MDQTKDPTKWEQLTFGWPTCIPPGVYMGVDFGKEPSQTIVQFWERSSSGQLQLISESTLNER